MDERLGGMGTRLDPLAAAALFNHPGPAECHRYRQVLVQAVLGLSGADFTPHSCLRGNVEVIAEGGLLGAQCPSARRCLLPPRACRTLP